MGKSAWENPESPSAYFDMGRMTKRRALGGSSSIALVGDKRPDARQAFQLYFVANYQPFGAIDNSRTGFGVARDPQLRNLNPPSNWANFTGIQGIPRVMQVALRYSF